ncbi:helix-turn-helix domain-containing protein [Mesorhizobium sp. YC-39]|uniref:helix-turn-helix domain-containing protein n=1 Tax=unclassified Mesorhizobium TaxID=325217 RepID=UPI0021E88C29|nr:MULTISPECIES: helix-turn-helix domain-containing protein [unclassified Mesorhizobium]MCV3211848.1 helix-turn-helix domain-containing protein [Mesorhizobium sp. YC-2]MCV3233571.1 helix-turn-helix domain-containing protein [Mesorhizobium sp. YC-39]
MQSAVDVPAAQEKALTKARRNWGMAGRQRVIDEDQKLELLQRMEAGETVSKLADEVGISRQRLYEWRDQLRLRGNLMYSLVYLINGSRNWR